MAITFPSSPSTNDTFTVNGRTYVWDGTAWKKVNAEIASVVPSLEVTGDFTGDTDTLHVDSTNDRVGIGTTSPAEELDVVGDIQVSGRLGIGSGISAELDIKGASNPEIRLQSTDSSDPFLYFGDQVDAVRGGIGMDTSANALQLRGYNNSTRMTIDSSGNVGIGTTTPDASLEVARTADGQDVAHFNGQVRLQGADPTRLTIEATNGSSNLWNIDNSNGTLRFFRENWAASGIGTGGAVRMSITDSGDTTFTGYVSQPRAFFRAHKAGNTGWSLTGVQTIVFDNTVFNSGNNYSTSTGRFTAPIAGYYALGAHFFKYTTYTNSTNTYWGIFTSNGYSTTTNHGTQGQDGGQSLSTIVFLGQGDYANVQITSAGSTIQSYGTMSFNSFYGYLLSA